MVDISHLPLEQIEAELWRRTQSEVARLRERIRGHLKAIEALELEMRVAQGLGKPAPPKARSTESLTDPGQVDPDDVLRVLAVRAVGVVALAATLQVPTKAVSRCLKALVSRGDVLQEGVKRGTVYRLRS